MMRWRRITMTTSTLPHHLPIPHQVPPPMARPIVCLNVLSCGLLIIVVCVTKVWWRMNGMRCWNVVCMRNCGWDICHWWVRMCECMVVLLCSHRLFVMRLCCGMSVVDIVV